MMGLYLYLVLEGKHSSALRVDVTTLGSYTWSRERMLRYELGEKMPLSYWSCLDLGISR